MPKFEIEKVITVKDYLLNRGLVEKGMTYYAFSILEEDGPQSYEKIVFDFFDNELGVFVSADRKSYEYLYPYEEPEKKYRPFKIEELITLLGKAVKYKEEYLKEKELQGNVIGLITRVETSLKDENRINFNLDWVSSKFLLDNCEFINADGTTSPCGVLEEE